MIFMNLFFLTIAYTCKPLIFCVRLSSNSFKDSLFVIPREIRIKAPIRLGTDRNITAISGIQPSGNVHIGNYIGCIYPCIKYQESKSGLKFMVADLHATSDGKQNKKGLSNHIKHVIAISLACGLDPLKSHIILQSQFPEILEFHWILSTIISSKRLSKLSQFKNRNIDINSESVATLLYPLLMAADITVFRSDYVIAGPDQTLHIALTRELVKRLNSLIGSDLIPTPQLWPFQYIKIKSLSDGNRKMSKSEDDAKNSINLLDPDDVIYNKIKSAKTETFDGSGDKCSLEVENLLNIYKFFSNTTDEMVKNAHLSNLFNLKENITSAIIDHLRPIKRKYNEIINDETYLSRVITSGRNALKPEVASNLAEIKRLLDYLD